MLVFVARGSRVSLFPVWERSRGLLVHVGSKVAAIRARDGSELPVRLGRWCANTASSPDISKGIASRDRDPRVSGQHSPNQRWDMRGYSIFLNSPVQARGANITSTFRYTGRLERPDYGLR